MNNDQIIKKIERGINDAPIDKMDQIKAAKVEKMAMHDHITKQSAKKLPIYKVAAIAAIFLFAFFGYRYQYVTPDTMVYLDVNPSFEIGINRAGKVVEVEGVNDEAKAVIESLSLEKMSIEEAVETITHKLVEMDYLRSDQNMILVSVYNKNANKRNAQSDTIEKVIKFELEKDLIESVVISQSLSVKTEDKDNLSISKGKLQFINTLLSMDPTLNKQDLASMSIQELVRVANRSDFSLENYFSEKEVKAIKQILFPDDDDDDDYDKDDKGTRITLDAARIIALKRVNGTIVDTEQDDDEYEFEITLEGTKYKIEINAYTGEIVKFEMDDDDDDKNYSATRITETEARRIALGLANGNIVKMDKGDNEYKFEIYFDGKEYKIEINAYTGAVIKLEVDDDDDDEYSNGTRITSEAARKIALNRVNGNIVKMDQDDDEYKFEIELEGTLYKIEIDAYTGEIVKFEMDDDDDDDDD